MPIAVNEDIKLVEYVDEVLAAALAKTLPRPAAIHPAHDRSRIKPGARGFIPPPSRVRVRPVKASR